MCLKLDQWLYGGIDTYGEHSIPNSILFSSFVICVATVGNGVGTDSNTMGINYKSMVDKIDARTVQISNSNNAAVIYKHFLRIKAIFIGL